MSGKTMKPKLVRKRNFSYSSRSFARSTLDASRTFTCPRKSRTKMEPVMGWISRSAASDAADAPSRARAASRSSAVSRCARSMSLVCTSSALSALARAAALLVAFACAFSADSISRL